MKSLELKGIRFAPAKLSRVEQKDELSLSVGDGASANQASWSNALAAGEKLVARVDLKDGRVVDLQTTIEPPRPKVNLISKNIQAGAAHSPVHLTNQDLLPQDGRMTFFLKTVAPRVFRARKKLRSRVRMARLTSC